MKKLFIPMLLLVSAASYADLTTGRSDALSLHYGETTKGDVKVFGSDFYWDLPVHPTNSSSLFLISGLSRWTDDSSNNNSLFSFHVGNGIDFLLSSLSPDIFPYLKMYLAAAYFSEKSFGGVYNLDSSFKAEFGAQLGLKFGQQSEYELGLGYSHYFGNGDQDIDLGPEIFVGYHF